MLRTSTRLVLDLALWTLATVLAFFVRLDGTLAPPYFGGLALMAALTLPVKAALIWAFRLHRRSFHTVGVRDLTAIALGVGFVLIFAYVARAFVPEIFVVPRSVPLIEAMLALLMLGGARMAIRLYSEQEQRRSAHPHRRAGPDCRGGRGRDVAGPRNAAPPQGGRHPDRLSRRQPREAARTFFWPPGPGHARRPRTPGRASQHRRGGDRAALGQWRCGAAGRGSGQRGRDHPPHHSGALRTPLRGGLDRAAARCQRGGPAPAQTG